MKDEIWRLRIRLGEWLLGEYAIDAVDAYHQGYEAGAEAARHSMLSVLRQDAAADPFVLPQIRAKR